MMIIRPWKYGSDDSYIMSFLNGMSMAHDESQKDGVWLLE